MPRGVRSSDQKSVMDMPMLKLGMPTYIIYSILNHEILNMGMPKLPRHVQIASKWACPKLPYKWACPQYLGMSKISIQMDMPKTLWACPQYLGMSRTCPANGHAHNFWACPNIPYKWACLSYLFYIIEATLQQF